MESWKEHMGVKGTYIAIENFLLSQIINGEKSILEIDPAQCRPLDADKSWRAILPRSKLKKQPIF